MTAGWEAALAELDAGLAEGGGSAIVLYHRACVGARASRLDRARQDLERAFELQPSLRERAGADADLEPLRDAL